MRHDHALALFAAICLLLAGCGAASPTKKTEERRGTSQRSSPADINVGLGQGYMRQGKYEIALDKLQKALELDPKLPSAHTVIAVLYETIGDYDLALTHYKRAAELAPRAGGELNNYGTFLCRQGKYVQADALFVRALADPFYKTPATALANRGTCAVSAGKLDVAEESFRQSIQRDPKNVEALYQLAEILFKRGDFFRARAFIQRFESAGKASPDMLTLAMRIEQSIGNQAAVREYRDRLYAEFPESDQAQSLREAEEAQ